MCDCSLEGWHFCIVLWCLQWSDIRQSYQAIWLYANPTALQRLWNFAKIAKCLSCEKLSRLPPCQIRVTRWLISQWVLSLNRVLMPSVWLPLGLQRSGLDINANRCRQKKAATNSKSNAWLDQIAIGGITQNMVDYHLHFSAAHEPPRYHGRSVAKSAHIIFKHSNKSPILDSISNQFLRERCSWLLHFNLSVFFLVSQSFLGCGLEFWLLYLAKTNWKSTHSTHMDLLWFLFSTVDLDVWWWQWHCVRFQSWADHLSRWWIVSFSNHMFLPSFLTALFLRLSQKGITRLLCRFVLHRNELKTI